MATLFPVLVELGVSRLSAAALIGTAACLDLGPASGASNMAAQTAGLDPMVYFVNYQLPVSAMVVPTISVLHYIVQKYCDKKMGFKSGETQEEKKNTEAAPKIYAILPLLPLIFLFVFSKLIISSISMDVITAMLLGITIALIFELVRKKRTCKRSIQEHSDFLRRYGTSVCHYCYTDYCRRGLCKGLAGYRSN